MNKQDIIEHHNDEVELHDIIQDNKKIYALTTFKRAIPYYKDGLIEIYRRALWCMIDNKYFYGKQIKSASPVGELIAKWHPHGDIAAYQSIVTLSQPWTNNHPLIRGYGNWGNVLGDPAASMRYTECSLSEFFGDVCETIRAEYVDFIPNFDEKYMEPDYIPFKVPILLVNGIFGIADSCTVSIPPHNLNDVITICKRYINNKNIRNDRLVEGFLPDFPNYGEILNKSDIEDMYKFKQFGSGNNIKMRATIDIDREENKIIIKDLPYMMVKNDILKTLKRFHTNKHAVLSNVLNIIEIHTTRDGEPHMEFEVVFDKNLNILEIARDLEKNCLSKTIPLSYTLTDGEFVHNVSILDIVKAWYSTLYTTKVRKIGYHTSILISRRHVLEGMLIIYDHMDDIITFIKKAKNKEEIVEHLAKKYKLTDIQADAIAEMKISQLTRVSKDNLIEQIKNMSEKIKELDEQLLTIDDEIMADLDTIGKKYGRPRRTKLIDLDAEQEEQTSIIISSGSLMWSHNQYAIFDLQNLINGKNLINGLKSIRIDGKNTREIVGTHNINNDIENIMIFHTDGTARKLPASDMYDMNNWIMVDDQHISAMVPVYSENDKFIIISPEEKIRMVSASDFTKNLVTCGQVSCVDLVENDKTHLLIVTESGKFHCIQITDIPELGRTASGVKVVLDSEPSYMVQIKMDSNDLPIVSLLDSEGYRYIMKIEQDMIYETNRVNKLKKLFDLEDGFKITGISKIDVSDKNAKNIMIGRQTIYNITTRNILTSDMESVPKRIPVEMLGIVNYNI